MKNFDVSSNILEKKVVLKNKMIGSFANHMFEKDTYLLFMVGENFQANFSVRKDVYSSVEVEDKLNIFYRECYFGKNFKEYQLEKIEKIYSNE